MNAAHKESRKRNRAKRLARKAAEAANPKAKEAATAQK